MHTTPDDIYQAIMARYYTDGAEVSLYRISEQMAALLTACEAWDQGFVDGEEFDADQLLAWVNRNRAMARAAIDKARGA
mgnify:CR=1 FL=1